MNPGLKYFIRALSIEIGAIIGYLVAALLRVNNSEPGLIFFGWLGAIAFLVPTLDTEHGYLLIQGKRDDVVPWKAVMDIVLVSAATIIGVTADYKEPGQAPYIPIATIFFVLVAVIVGLVIKAAVDSAVNSSG